MLLLQSAIAGGFTLLFILFIMLIAGIPFFMIWYRHLGRKIFSNNPPEQISNAEKLVRFLGRFILAAITIAIIFFLLVVLIDYIFPQYASDN